MLAASKGAMTMNTKEFERRVRYVMKTKKVSRDCARYWVRRYAEAKEK